MDLSIFLESTVYTQIDDTIKAKASELFAGLTSDIEKTKKAFIFVRDEIPHCFDVKKDIIVATAIDVLKTGFGICHSKSNLLTALLRSAGIKTGFCYQHITLADDDSLGYCLHCFNAVWLDNRWIKLDARGNTNGINAQFSLDQPQLAFPIRDEYDEYFIKGIYATPHKETMLMLEQSNTVDDVLKNIPCLRTDKPYVAE